MNTTKKNLIRLFVITWVVLFTVFSEPFHVQIRATSFSEAQRKEVKDQIRKSIRIAEKLFQEEKYINAFRVLYDAAKEEAAAELPMDAGYIAYKMIEHLIHQEQSSLMQYLRNTEIPVSEKNHVLAELKALAGEENKAEKDTPLKKKFTGSLVHILTSPQLTTEEKNQIVRHVTFEVRKHYISEKQKRQILNGIIQELSIAEQRFQEGQYAEAFRFILNSGDKELEAGVIGHASDYYHEYLDLIAVKDASPLMKFLRDTKISWQEKQHLFAELQELAENPHLTSKRVPLQGRYDGPVVQLMSSSKLSAPEKLDILGYIREVIEREYSPIP